MLRAPVAVSRSGLAGFSLHERDVALLTPLQDGSLLDRTTTATLMRRPVDRGLVHGRPQPGNGRALVPELTEAGAAARLRQARIGSWPRSPRPSKSSSAALLRLRG